MRTEDCSFVLDLVASDFIPYEYLAGRYAGFIPGVSHTRLDKGEGHFIFLNECDSQSEIYGMPIYRDKKGVSRTAVHRRLNKEITDFFARQFSSGLSPFLSGEKTYFFT